MSSATGTGEGLVCSVCLTSCFFSDARTSHRPVL